jgi:hypothetical protein
MQHPDVSMTDRQDLYYKNFNYMGFHVFYRFKRLSVQTLLWPIASPSDCKLWCNRVFDTPPFAWKGFKDREF